MLTKSAALPRAAGFLQGRKAGTRRLFSVVWVGMFSLAALAGAGPALAAELLMFTRKSCAYCLLWDRQLGAIYPKTSEGQQAPLRKIDLDDTAAAALAFSPPVTITPTFVLMNGTTEIGRFSGYSDDLTFWSLLATHLKKLGNTAASAPNSHEKPTQ